MDIRGGVAAGSGGRMADLSPPAELLPRVRWVFLGIALLSLVAALLVVSINQGTPSLQKLLAAAGAGWLGWSWVSSYRRGVFHWEFDVISAAAMLALVIAIGDPEYALAMLGAGASMRALYASPRGSLLVALQFELPYLAGVWLAHLPGHPQAAAAPLLLGVPGIALAIGIGQLLHAALERHEAVLARAQRLRDAGIELSSAPTPERIIRAASGAAQGFVPESSLVQVVWVRRSGTKVLLSPPVGPGGEVQPSVTLSPDSVPEVVLPVVLGAAPLGPEAGLTMQLISTLRLDPRNLSLLVVPLSASHEARGCLGVASRKPLAGELTDSYRTLAAQVGMALSRADLSQSIRQSEARFRGLVQNSADLVIAVGEQSEITYVSPSVETFLGRPLAELRLDGTSGAVHPQDMVRLQAAVKEATLRNGRSPMPDLRMRHRSGEWRLLEVQATNLLQDKDVRAVVLTARDVTERKALEERLRHQALHDPLTGLANRLLLRDRIDHALHARRSRLPLGLLVIDLDDFKNINDSYGHAAGDQALLEVTRLVRLCLRPGDTFARLGGDEFAILLEELSSPEFAETVAERIGATLQNPIRLPTREEVAVTASIGVVTCEDTGDPDVLLRNADIALYAAKGEGKGRHVVFRDFLHERALHRMHVESGLRRALERDELRLHYQPIVTSTLHQLVGVEALLRWQDPEHQGLILPDGFVSVAEATGMIVPLGRWVLSEACRQVRQWQATIPGQERIRLTVNVSARQLQEASIINDVEAALAASGLAAGLLVLEVTESTIATNPKAATARLSSLRSMGVKIAIDDFGTGQSSLAQLQLLPVDAIKIDQSFVRRLSQDPTAAAVIQSVVDLGRALRLEVIVEGIETARQARLLAELCPDAHMQGHYFSPPLTPEELELVAATPKRVRPPRLQRPVDGALAEAVGTHH
ncbi:MAG: putative bifunctional diguanylate cyclase/phosphodiesterase [Candidatus Dormibacteria bacterium]